MRRVRGLLGRVSVAMLMCAGLPAASVALNAQTAAAALPSNCTGTSTVTCTFEYNGTDGTDGSEQTFTVPEKVTVVTIDAWGAQGGAGAFGGLGGHNASTIAVTPGQVYEIRVGGQPEFEASAGGYNGGGTGGAFSGGGASDVRPAGGDLSSRIVTAGGGGGAGSHGTAGGPVADAGGAGGGGDGATEGCLLPGVCGHGATETAGGGPGSDGGASAVPCSPQGGSFGTGGSSGCAGGGGGGGWYGGGAGDMVITGLGGAAGPGGGGSGHIASGVNRVSEQGVRSGHGLVTISYSTKPVPPLGEVACAVTGTASFTKPLTHTPSAKPVKVTVKLAGSTCENSDVVGGKAPITDVAAKGTFFLNVGSTCSLASSSAVKPQKLKVKWQGRNSKNKLTTVAVTNTSVNASTYSVFVPGLFLNGPTLTDPKKPFVNDHIAANLIVPNGLPVLQAMCASPDGLTTIDVLGTIGAVD